MVMMMVPAVVLARCLQVLLQLREQVLGGGRVAGLERLAQCRQIVLH